MHGMKQSVALTLFLGHFSISFSQDVDCPCKTDVTFPSSITNSAGRPTYRGVAYPVDYGEGCNQHDTTLAPYCADSSGNALPDAPDWCEQQWCWIDKDDCDLPITFESSYFPNVNLYYSYQTCGTSNSFSSWFQDGNTDGRTLADLVTVRPLVPDVSMSRTNMYYVILGSL